MKNFHSISQRPARAVQGLAASFLWLGLGLGIAVAGTGDSARAGQAGTAQGGPGTGKTVFVLPVHGPIDKAMLYAFRRAFRQEKRLHPAAIIVDLDTPGGGLRETDEIIDWMRSTKVPRYAYVNPRAISAGAIISLSTQAIFMAPGSQIGSSMPVVMNPLTGGIQEVKGAGLEEKILSVVRAKVRGLAEENGYDPKLAMAMVDRSIEVKIGNRVICKKGELLNLTAQEAIEIIPPRKKPLLARAIEPSISALLDTVGLRGAKVVVFKELPAERLARYITMFGPILLALGLLGIYIEFKTPGFGFPGIFGIVCLGIYFFGHYVAGLAGIEDIALVVIGLVLVALEIFVIPGHGITGVLGALCILAGVILGLIPRLPHPLVPLPGVPSLDFQIYIEAALRKILETIVIMAGGIWALGRVLPKTPLYGKLVLQAALSRDAGFVASDVPSEAEDLIGLEGVARSNLRPAGIAIFGNRRLDVVTEGDMIRKGERVRIIATEGSRIVVERIAG